MLRSLCLGMVVTLAAVLTSGAAHGYSGGPTWIVTDLTTGCASCHSSMQKSQLRTEREQMAAAQFVENKHYRALEEGTGSYKDMSPEDRQKLLADVKLMDQHASVTLAGPASAKPGQEIQLTATVQGGHGVVGVFLMESDLRFQGRSLASDGWVVVGAPKVWGADGKEQTKWVDSRGPELKKNLASVLIFDQQSDLAGKKFPQGKVVWTVRAPPAPGSYPVAVGFAYGTEKASPYGRVTNPSGVVLPRGGGLGPSGRILFSTVHTITVR
jgi:hypothetical protein